MKKTITTLILITILLSSTNIADAREKKFTPLKNLKEKLANRGLINRTLTRLPIIKNRINYIEMNAQPTIRLTSKSCANGNCSIQAYDF